MWTGGSVGVRRNSRSRIDRFAFLRPTARATMSLRVCRIRRCRSRSHVGWPITGSGLMPTSSLTGNQRAEVDLGILERGRIGAHLPTDQLERPPDVARPSDRYARTQHAI